MNTSTLILQLHPALERRSRLRRLRAAMWPVGTDFLPTESLVLVCCGVLAALTVLLPEIKLQIPGHAIFRTVFIMAFGLALIPRYGAGTLMAVGAVATTVVCREWGQGKDGLGSIASLCLTGPSLDLILRFARTGPQLLVGLAGAGLLSNLLAFGLQYTDKVWHWARSIRGAGGGAGTGGGGGRGLPAWLAMASWSYPLFGIAAGLLSAGIWFRVRNSDETSETIHPPGSPQG